MTFQIKSELLISLNNWQTGLNKANKQMAGFGKSMKTISNGVKAAWAGVALGAIGSVYDAIVDVTKAAAEDNRSMAVLNEQMKRTWGGNEELNKSIDAQIDKMSNATGIMDDELRPALTRIAAVTKSPAKGMKMLGLATDIAAKQSIPLNTVSKAMAKFLGGNKTALDKLIPGLKESGDRMKFLTENYEGFAEVSGQNDPFGRITVTVENFKEKLGQAFLPLANDFADWLAGPEAQAELDEIANKVKETFAWLNSDEGKQTIKEWVDRISGLTDKIAGMVDGLLEFLAMVESVQPENNPIIEQTNAATGSTAATDAALLKIEEMSNPWEYYFGGGKERADAALANLNNDPGTVKFAGDTTEQMLEMLGPFKEIGRWFGETSGQIDKKVDPPVVNVTVSPITGRQTVDIINNYGRTKGVVPGSLFN